MMDQDSLLDTMTAVRDYLEAGNRDATRRCLDDLIANYQTEWSARNFAAACFERLGEQDRAWIEAGIALALDPNNYAACKRFARYLERDGQQEAARRILEHGWDHMKKLYPKKQWTDERALYFAFSEDGLPPHLAARWRSKNVQPAQIEEIKANLKHFRSDRSE